MKTVLKYKKTTVNTRFSQYAYLMLTVRPHSAKHYHLK